MNAVQQDWQLGDDDGLAPYAMRSCASRGRRYPEPLHPYRTVFQRDRERIVHSTGFRRLMGKTQVLVAQINDHHRTRLTHTLEVTQISRTIARRLGLQEDLTEAIALSHDLGHPPFGHAGEEALDACLHAFGGFDHNLQGLRQVEECEDRYPDVPGLNLSWEVREAFAQHSKRLEASEAQRYRAAGAPLLEAQVVDAADSLAYDVHDVDDALGIGIISLADLDGVGLWTQVAGPIRTAHPSLMGNRFRTAVLRELISSQIVDLLQETQRRLQEDAIESLQKVRAATRPLVDFSRSMLALKQELEQFLLQRVYRHPRVLRMANKGQNFLKALFAEFIRRPELLPPRHLRRWQDAPAWLRQDPSAAPWERTCTDPLERIVADYLAGMTDRYAQQEYLRLFQPSGDL